jgi:hypothetical protein
VDLESGIAEQQQQARPEVLDVIGMGKDREGCVPDVQWDRGQVASPAWWIHGQRSKLFRRRWAVPEIRNPGDRETVQLRPCQTLEFRP